VKKPPLWNDDGRLKLTLMRQKAGQTLDQDLESSGF
jgi:hypothetical protein